MPKDGRIKYHPNFKKNNTSFQKLIFSVLTKPRFRSRKTSSFATTGWWPRSLEVMDLFSSHPRGGGPFFGRDELKGAKGGSYTYPGFDQHILVGFFLFEVLVFFWLGPQKKIILKLEKGPQKKTKQLIFCMLRFFGRFFREIFLFVMFVLCFCGGEKERAAVYQPDTTRKPLGFMGKSTFVCSLAIWKEKWWVPNDYFLEI